MTHPTQTPPTIPGLISPSGQAPATYAAPPTGASISGPAPAQPVTAPPGTPDSTTVTANAPAAATPHAASNATGNTPATPPPAPAETAAPADPPANTPGEHGYPANTPLEQMSAEQREAYWRYHSRKWENIAKGRNDYDELRAKAAELEQLRAATATDAEKAVAAARAAGYAEATQKASTILVDAHVRAALGNRLTPDRVDALAATLDHRHFLGADGLSVDAAKVTAFADAVAPTPASAATVQPGLTAVPQAAYPAPATTPVTAPPAAPPQLATGLPRALPDMGQGSTVPAKPSGLAAGAEMARQMFPAPKQRS